MSLMSSLSDFASGNLTSLGSGLLGLNTSDLLSMTPLVGAGYTNAKNFGLSQDQFQYAQWLQGQSWLREDNAVQRRRADLEAAGLSPTLAAGQAASSGPVVSTQAPQRQYSDIPSQIAGIMGLLKMKEDISNTVAQRDLIAAQTNAANINADLADANTDLANANASLRWNDFKILKKWGMPSTATGLGADLRNIGSFLDSPIVKSARDELKDKYNKAVKIKQKVDKAVEDSLKNLIKSGPEKNMFNSDDYK